jgi:hypothetical protein
MTRQPYILSADFRPVMIHFIVPISVIMSLLVLHLSGVGSVVLAAGSFLVVAFGLGTAVAVTLAYVL